MREIALFCLFAKELCNIKERHVTLRFVDIPVSWVNLLQSFYTRSLSSVIVAHLNGTLMTEINWIGCNFDKPPIIQQFHRLRSLIETFSPFSLFSSLNILIKKSSKTWNTCGNFILTAINCRSLSITCFNDKKCFNTWVRCYFSLFSV